ncbi:hypothetical protein [Salimicrobium flavidum]|uniref:Uncharacterized protein n=1 Tax=Salimicrobium flavidum TaxID=570947 RepID=A0A1N7JS01_9BACI|nr:hypothetical protein [Salimicrobium flavidum]SIS52128.1 hypothetical protein SAMN05421687_107124 [Salimicrobium flavidum]
MNWETLPSWFWAIYYLFLLITLGATIFSIRKRELIGLSVVAIMITIIAPTVSLLNSIGRARGMNEFEHLVSQLQQGAIWSILVVIGYLFLLVWWAFFLFKKAD